MTANRLMRLAKEIARDRLYRPGCAGISDAAVMRWSARTASWRRASQSRQSGFSLKAFGRRADQRARQGHAFAADAQPRQRFL